jgi:hypothetical protein
VLSEARSPAQKPSQTFKKLRIRGAQPLSVVR